jgi:hypothetical protein
MVQRLVSLETDKRRGITKSTAEKLCTNLFGVATAHPSTEHAPKAAGVPVTPEASQDVTNISAVTAKRRLF